MDYVNDDLLLEVYKDALTYKTDKDFIILIEQELKKRGIFELANQKLFPRRT